VESNITPAVRLEQFDASFGELFRRSDDVHSFSISTESNDGSVLKQEKNIANATFFAQLDQLLL
jgi:hypothetical protein